MFTKQQLSFATPAPAPEQSEMVTVKNVQTGETKAVTSEEAADLNPAKWQVIVQQAPANSGNRSARGRANAVPAPRTIDKATAIAIREKQLENSLACPAWLQGSTTTVKVVAFEARTSPRTGNEYVVTKWEGTHNGEAKKGATLFVDTDEIGAPIQISGVEDQQGVSQTGFVIERVA